MPDITLYREDVIIIRDALSYARAEIEHWHCQRELTTRELNVLENAHRLDGLLYDRLVQALHPTREDGPIELVL
jgi:hypothetical protein